MDDDSMMRILAFNFIFLIFFLSRNFFSASVQIGRNQFVLDLSRKEVRDYLFDAISEILANANIEYLKWDMNRYRTFSIYFFVKEKGLKYFFWALTF